MCCALQNNSVVIWNWCHCCTFPVVWL